MAMVQAKFPEESPERVAVFLTRSLDEWKMGAVEQAGRSLEEALRLARGLKGLPQPVLVGDQIGVMSRYDAFLKATHRGSEATQMEAEMGRLAVAARIRPHAAGAR